MQMEYLKVRFSTDERTDNAMSLARANQQLNELETQKAQLAAAIKAQIEEQRTAIQRLARWVNDGYEYRNVEVKTIMDSPTNGQKTIVRLDTGEEVRIAAMTDNDRQQVLFEEEKAAAAAPNGAPKRQGKTAATPAS